MEKQQKCKCTTPWIAGIAIGIGIATVSCLVYFFVLNDGCISGDCEAFVAKQLPTNQPLVAKAPGTVIKYTSTPEVEVDPALQDEGEICVQNCLDDNTFPTEQECTDWCDDIQNARSLTEQCNDTIDVGGEESPLDEVCTETTVQGSCYETCRDCNSGVETTSACTD
ncbi:hypothetical protein KKC88_03455 [Patescibacteria group bacterium]|nr:hypothetical protein [Patescibacteria group bacterium]MBU1673571.1 hypothetical protein [Patescibacteria group bacterium]MBU1963649.1 hypothetical protein [Patescibacteria group bacterium]